MKIMDAIRNAAPSPSSPDHTATTSWIPRAVRCPRCQELAHEEIRERQSDEVAVRYGCETCRWQQVRHYHIEEN